MQRDAMEEKNYIIEIVGFYSARYLCETRKLIYDNGYDRPASFDTSIEYKSLNTTISAQKWY